MPTAEPIVSEPSTSKLDIATEKLKMHKSPGINQILPQLIQAGGNTQCSEIHKLINGSWNME